MAGSSFMKSVAAGGLLAALSLQPALAQDFVDGALERLREIAAQQGARIGWEDQRRSGADVELIGVRAGQGRRAVPVGDVLLRGVTHEDGLGYRIASISLPVFSVIEDDFRAVVTGISLGEVILPDEDRIDEYGGFLFYGSAEIEHASIGAEGAEIFSMSDLSARVTDPASGDPMDFTGAVEAFSIDLTTIPDENQRAILRALDYEVLTGRIDMEGYWNPQDGGMALSRNDVTVHDAGTLGISLDLGGYTSEFVASVRQLQEAAAANPNQDDTAQGLALLGLMQQLTFHSADISFDDDGLTGRLLEFFAEQQGVRPADVANQAKALLPFALAQLGNAQLTAMASDAVSAFLDDPQRLNIRARPAAPVPFSLIGAGAMSDPHSLVGTLGVGVTAND